MLRTVKMRTQLLDGENVKTFSTLYNMNGNKVNYNMTVEMGNFLHNKVAEIFRIATNNSYVDSTITEEFSLNEWNAEHD